MDQTLETLRSTLADRYRLDKAVGRGGMATVYLAHDIRHDRKVAIKVMDPELTATIGADRFNREVKIAAKLAHPNILGVYDSGETQRLLFYVMPFVEGETLRDKLTRERQLSIDESIQIICEVAEALGHAHSQGVVHRDIKPENILLQDGRAMVADFGIARLAEAEQEKLTKTGMAVGTAQYMSPEQAAGEPTDARSDIYALGCTLFEMLSGQAPFMGNNAMAIMSQHALATVPEIRAMRTNVPEELGDVIRRAMEKTPADRFQTMEDFKRAVLGEIPATTTTLPKYTARYRVQGPVRTGDGWKKWAVAGVVALVLVAGGIAYKNYLKAGAPADANRVAVLYFTDETGGSMQHIADGLTESLIERLEEIPALIVTPLGGVRQLRGHQVGSDSVRSVFGVGTIVKGSVTREGSEVKVNINVVDAYTDASYERKGVKADTTQVASLQGVVADEVAGFLREVIGNEVRLKADRGQARSTAVWTLAERAAKLRKDADSLIGVRAEAAALAALVTADSLLARAQVEDPRWAKLPATRAANAVIAARLLPRRSPPQRAALDSGLAMAAAALRIQSTNADALEARGRLLYLDFQIGFETDPERNRLKLDSAEAALARATEADPGHAGAWAALSNLLYAKPDVQGAKIAARRAYAADQYLASAKTILTRLFWTSHDTEEYPEALESCTTGQKRYPSDPFFVSCRLWMYTTRSVAKPNIDSAWVYHSRYVALNDPEARPYADKFARILVAGALARAGEADSARSVLLSARATPELDPTRELAGNEAIVRVILGDHDIAVDLIESYLAKNPTHRRGFATRVSPWWRDLQNHPRYKRLVATAQ